MVRQRWGMAPPEAAKQGYAKNPLRACLKFGYGWSEQYLWAVPLQSVLWQHFAPRDLKALCEQTDPSSLHPLQIIPCLYTRKKMEGLQRATFPELRFYWSRFPTLCFNYSTILSSQKYIASWHFGTSFQIQRNAPSTGGRRAVDGPSHDQKLFCSKAASAERGASCCAIHCTQSQAFSSLSENGTKGNISCKRKTIRKQQCWSAVLQN